MRRKKAASVAFFTFKVKNDIQIYYWKVKNLVEICFSKVKNRIFATEI